MSKKNKTTNSILLVAVKGIITGMLVFTIFLAAFAAILVYTDINPFFYFVFYLVAVFFASFAAAFVTVKKIKVKPIIIGLFSALIISSIILLISVAACNFKFSAWTLLCIPIALIGAVIGTVIRSNLK